VTANPTGLRMSGCTINVLIDREISICTQPNGDSFYETLDIPFELVSTAEIANTVFEEVPNIKTHPVDLVLLLHTTKQLFCYANAAPVEVHEIRITVHQEELAEAMGQEILEELELRSRPKISKTREVINVGPRSTQLSQQTGSSQSSHKSVVPDSHDQNSNDIFQGSLTGAAIATSQEQNSGKGHSKVIPDSQSENQTQDAGRTITPSIVDLIAADNDIAAIVPPYEQDADNMQIFGSEFAIDLPDLATEHNFNGDVKGREKTPSEEEIDKLLTFSTENDINHEGPAVVESLSAGPRIKNTPSSAASKSVPSEASHGEDGFVDIEELLSPPLPLTKSHRHSSLTRPTESRRATGKHNKLSGPKQSKTSVRKKETRRPKKPALKPKVVAKEAKASSSKVPSAATKSDAPRASKRRSENDTRLGINGNTTRLHPSTTPPVPSTGRFSAKAEHHLVEMDKASQQVPKTKSESLPTVAVNHHAMPENRAVKPFASKLSALLEGIDDNELPGFGTEDAPVHSTSDDYQVGGLHEEEEEVELSSSSADSNDPPHLQQEVSTERGTPEKKRLQRLTTQTPTRRSPRLISRAKVTTTAILSSNRKVTPIEQGQAPSSARSPKRKTPTRRQSAGTPTRRSPRLLAQTQAAAATLNSVLAPKVPLVDPHLARKTPLVSFSAKGPRNQGRISGSKILRSPLGRADLPASHSSRADGSVQAREAKSKQPNKDSSSAGSLKDHGTSKSHMSNLTDLREAKRKRIDDIHTVAKRQQISKLQNSKATESRTKRPLPFAFQGEDDHIVAFSSPTERNPPVFNSQSTRVDENGSPRASTIRRPRTNYDAVVSKVLKQIPTTHVNVDQRNKMSSQPIDDDLLPPTSRDSSLALLEVRAIKSSHTKTVPLTAHPVRRVVNRRAPETKKANDIHIDLEAEELVVPPQGIADPFLEKKQERKMSDFSRRLQGQRQKLIYDTLDRQSHAGVPKRKNTPDEDLEETLVNIENEAPTEHSLTPSDMTEQNIGDYSDREPQMSEVNVDSASWDEWRMALKPHQRGILDALYQISNVSALFSGAYSV
jgi:hypothetical protein